MAFTRKVLSESNVVQKQVVVPLIPHWINYKKISIGSTQIDNFKVTMLEALNEDKNRNIESWITRKGKLMMIIGVREMEGCSFFYRIPIIPYGFNDRKYNIKLSKRLLVYKPDRSGEDKEVFFTPENLPVMEKSITQKIKSTCMSQWTETLPLLKMSPEGLQKQYDLYLKSNGQYKK